MLVFEESTMQYKKVLLAFALTIAFSPLARADHSVDKTRQQVVTQYLSYLEKADYKAITQLFIKNGVVVSTSKGKIDAKEFFYGFLPEIKSATIETHSRFVQDQENPDKFAARFHFNFVLKDGELGDGEYIDEFIFGSGINATKLTAVYMFENVKFPNKD